MTLLPDDIAPWTEGDPRGREDRMLGFLADVIVRGESQASELRTRLPRLGIERPFDGTLWARFQR